MSVIVYTKDLTKSTLNMLFAYGSEKSSFLSANPVGDTVYIVGRPEGDKDNFYIGARLVVSGHIHNEEDAFQYRIVADKDKSNYFINDDTTKNATNLLRSLFESKDNPLPEKVSSWGMSFQTYRLIDDDDIHKLDSFCKGLTAKVISPQDIEDSSYQSDINSSGAGSTNKKTGTVNYYDRDRALGRECLKKSNYQCVVNPEHQTFKSPSTKQQFMEAHHVIPMFAQENYGHQLDNLNNLVSLCPNCHRKIHYGDILDKQKLINKIFNAVVTPDNTFFIKSNIQTEGDLYNFYE